MEIQLYALLTSALDGGKWSVSHPCRFTTQGKNLGTHRMGGWVGPRAAGLDTVVKRKILSPCWDSNPRSSSAIPLSYPGSYITMVLEDIWY
jgi:hypothetical protein